MVVQTGGGNRQSGIPPEPVSAHMSPCAYALSDKQMSLVTATDPMLVRLC